MSEAAAASLPNDVVFDILSRTPVRSVCRLRCVSRGWRALTSDPAFHAAHKSCHIDPFLVDTGNFRGGQKPGIRIRDMDGNVVRVIDGVGGLGMVSTTSLDDLVCVHNDSHHQGVHVVDPATGEVLLTSPGLEVRDDDDPVTGLYYPCFAIGRAGASPSDAYKMVRLSRAGVACDVLTIGGLTGWRKVRAHPFPNYAPDNYAPPVAINGIMYFMTQERPSDGTLLCLDLEKEQWMDDPVDGPRKVVGQELWDSSTVSAHITELNGALYFVQREHRNMRGFKDDLCTSIWILDNANKSNWTRAFRIPMSSDLYGCYHTPLRVMNDGESLLLQHDSDDAPWLSVLQVYDLRTKACTDVAGAPASNIGLRNLDLEHLVSIKN